MNHSNINISKSLGVLKISSPAFKDGTLMPRKYTCQGDDISPPLVISGLSQNARSLVLIVYDPDAPMGNWDHWVMWNIPLVGSIGEGTVPAGALQGVNSFGDIRYGGPCPPSGTHRYVFKLYALDTLIGLEEGATRSSVEDAMKGHVIDSAQLTGLYRKS